jgi:hypothetical protein
MNKSSADDDYQDWLSNQIWEEAFEFYLKQGCREDEAEEGANRSLDYFLSHGG